jgi:hypothetical protein
MMRKLAREAVIFALLGMLVAIIGAFVITDSRARSLARSEAAKAVHGIQLPPSATLVPAQQNDLPTVQVPLTNGVLLHVRSCPPQYVEPAPSNSAQTKSKLGKYQFSDIDKPDKPSRAGRDWVDEILDCENFSDPFAKYGGRGHLTAIPLGNPDQVAIEKDYWAAYRHAKKQVFTENVLMSLLFGLYGFPAGVALWIFYRLVRFAVKG